MSFQSISLESWRQFEDVDIQFHPRLTVLTGANATGKTTILNLLSRHFGWNLQLLSTPAKGRTGVKRFMSDLWRRVREPTEATGLEEMGSIVYSEGQIATLLVPAGGQETYQVRIQEQQPVSGLFITSHRPVYVYHKVVEIPTELDAREQLFERYVNDLRQRYTPRARTGSASYEIKRALLSLAAFGYGNAAIQENPEAIETYEGFQRVLRLTLPESLGFERFDIRPPDIVLQTLTGEFPFDSVSGGIAALIDISWQIHMLAQIGPKFVVLIDEPENHLHPELQRTILPSLLRAFPEVQFIVATHNPFIVSAVVDSAVYALRYKPNGKVAASELDAVNRAGSSSEILRDVLGLTNAMPKWVEDRLREIIGKYAPVDLNETTLSDMKADLEELGLADLLPEALAGLLDSRNDQAD